MADLPITPQSPAPAAVAPPAATPSPRDSSASDGCARDNDDSFHTVLAQELGLIAPGHARSGPIVETAEDRTAPKAGDDASQARAASDIRPDPVIIGVIPLLQASSGERNVLATAVRADLAPDKRQDPLPKSARAANTETPFPAAAEFSATGKFLPAGTAEIRREIAFDTGRQEPHPAALVAPVAFAAIPSATAAPPRFAHAPAVSVDVRVGERGWDQALGDKLVWMTGQNRQVAQLHLNPPELGPLQITLTLDKGEASAAFVSAHAPVRDAIESAMPKLREMLADAGIALGNASVGADASRDQAQPQQQRESRVYTAHPIGAAADPGFVTGGTQLLPLSRGLVDIFA